MTFPCSGHLTLSFLGHSLPEGIGALQDHATGSNFPPNSMTLAVDSDPGTVISSGQEAVPPQNRSFSGSTETLVGERFSSAQSEGRTGTEDEDCFDVDGPSTKLKYNLLHNSLK